MALFRRKTTFKVHLTLTEFYSRLNEMVDTTGDISLNPFKKSPHKYIGEITEGKFSLRLNSKYENRDDYDTMFSQFSSTQGRFEEKENAILVYTTTEIRPELKIYFRVMTTLTIIFMTLAVKGGWAFAILTLTFIAGILYWSVLSTYSRWFEDFALDFKKEKTLHNINYKNRA